MIYVSFIKYIYRRSVLCLVDSLRLYICFELPVLCFYTIPVDLVIPSYLIMNCDEYYKHDVIPSGLLIKLLPQTPGSDSNSLNRKWDQTLFFTASNVC